ncbi:hypothetical protein [Herbiconiux sp.]|uniref:hypothetical protein n=1 Tax=Herbiconiux sp. TaxID=1871186 RepID=UPI0025BC9C58|nr:hypothetical protein [Herbiconiux sp.]
MEWWQIDFSSYPSVFDWVAMGLTILGFVIAFCQLRRTQNAVNASIQTEDSVRTTLIQNQIKMAIAEIESVIKDLGTAVSLGNKDLAERTLVRYANLCSGCAGLMRKLDTSDLDFADQLDESSRNASQVKEDIVVNRTAPRVALIPIYGEMSAISTGASKMNLELIFTVPMYGSALAKKKAFWRK